jgi:hypothetical protein
MQAKYHCKGSGEERKAFWLEVQAWVQHIAKAGVTPVGRLADFEEWAKENKGRQQSDWGINHGGGNWRRDKKYKGQKTW